jgi:hypothetical protein
VKRQPHPHHKVVAIQVKPRRDALPRIAPFMRVGATEFQLGMVQITLSSGIAGRTWEACCVYMEDDHLLRYA